MSDTTHYALSQDYEQMFVLLENGPLLGFVDYEHGSTLRDPVQIKRVADGKYFEYRAGVRGFGYINAFSKDAKDKFVEQCRKYNLSFIVPNADAEARAEELEEYIAKLVCELTDGKLSKPYDISVITDEVESIYRAYAEDEIAKATAKTEAENARLRAELETAKQVAASAQAVAQEAWAGEIPSPLPGHKRANEEELLAQVEHLNCPLCGGSGHIGDCEGD